jgi:pyruvate/2-oxoglutarate dehydrogenase complex dihydrolipoamide dehydrogenase (E3) component
VPETGAHKSLLPDNEYDRRLLREVHPSDWTNPVPRDRYHLVVVGGGTAGLVSAAGAAGLGARVALVERDLLGGDCLNVGCVPSKGMIGAARAWHRARRAADFGAPGIAGAGGDFAVAMERMRRIRADMAPHDGATRFRDLGVDVFLGHGRFTAPDTIEVDGEKLRFRRAVIATGARAAAIPIPGLAEAGYLTNETVFSLTDLPCRLAVVGAGPIGCELAQSFARFGSEVTLLDAAGHILPREDADAAAIVERALVRDGVRVLTGVEISGVARTGNESGERRISFTRAGRLEEIAADEILVAVGRAANVENLGLGIAGVEYDPTGIRVDDRLRTTSAKIFACGDVASAYKFTHTADAQARIVIQNALFFGRVRTSRLVIPWCTYTSPELAHVGLSAADAARDGVAIDTVRVPFADVDRALLDGEEEGFLAVHVKKGGDAIVGATIVGAHAGDMIGELVLAMTAGIGLGKIAATIHPYPTQGEIIKKAADAWRRTKLTPLARRVFAAYFRLVR